MSSHRDKPPLVGHEHFEVLVIALSVIRKKHGGVRDMKRSTRDMADALETLRVCGFVILPRGWIDSFKRIVELTEERP